MNDRQIVTAQEMRQLDRLTIEQRRITAYELMVQAGTACETYLYHEHLCDFNGFFVVVAGPGNNGGDAVIVFRNLLEHGVHAHLIQVGQQEHYSDELTTALASLKPLKPTVHLVENEDDLALSLPWLEQANTIIDGLFGVGLTRKVEGMYASLIQHINHSYATVISLDLPSGIHADNGLVMGISVEAHHTLVIQNYKQGNLLNDALDYTGKQHLIDVGILQTVFPDTQVMLDRNYLNKKIPERRHNSYKYLFGNILTIGGSKGMMGAPLLSAYTALRMGSGLSNLLTLDKYRSYGFYVYPDVMMNTYDGIEEIPSLVRNKSAIIFGPGLGRKDDINKDVLSYLLSTDIPLVIDADGIHYLKQLLPDYSKRPNIVITPHYKEMSDFLGISMDEVRYNPVAYARNIAHTYNLTVVLKGTCTIITNNEDTLFSVYGNPGLATAGTGDVLSGMIGNLLGRGYPPMKAAKLGVLFHSIAGEYARDKFGEESMIASDLIDMIPQVMRHARR